MPVLDEAVNTENLLKMIPVGLTGKHLVVEGGHFTIRRKTLDKTSVLEGEGVFYFKAPVATPILNHETIRMPVKKAPDRCWIVLTLDEGDRVDLPASIANQEISSIVPADARYLELLDRAIGLFQAMKTDVARASFCLLIGNLHLPEELRSPFRWALSAAFRGALDRIDESSLILLAESACQNKGGDKVLKPARRACANSSYSDYLYDRFGYAIVSKVGDTGDGYWFCADALLEPSVIGHPVIALTKYGPSRPSCAVTMAGKMMLLAAEGATDHVALYDACDDPLIQQKSVEGSMVVPFFAKDRSIVSVTMVVEGNNRVSVAFVDPGPLGKPGRLPGRVVLIEETMRSIQNLGLERIERRSAAVCCEIPSL